ncbi:hypothetical protein QBC35DRAFT_152047 [Podospora australis]|uniref:Uncharacterized protein n=1 Tax=Podospora australis TaxID=1536484 RepID=A0AAN7AKV2_9PEZI|nr:hypothetical protein QBC35DRAFT_152047 [Podospora australis]
MTLSPVMLLFRGFPKFVHEGTYYLSTITSRRVLVLPRVPVPLYGSPLGGCSRSREARSTQCFVFLCCTCERGCTVGVREAVSVVALSFTPSLMSVACTTSPAWNGTGERGIGIKLSMASPTTHCESRNGSGSFRRGGWCRGGHGSWISASLFALKPLGVLHAMLLDRRNVSAVSGCHALDLASIIRCQASIIRCQARHQRRNGLSGGESIPKGVDGQFLLPSLHPKSRGQKVALGVEVERPFRSMPRSCMGTSSI